MADVARRYPSGTVAAQVLGFVDIDGHGQAGIEQQYDGLLRGHPGKIQLERDPQGRAIPQGRRSLEPAEPGTDLVLTIDQHLQYVTEQALYRAVREHKAKAGSVVVMSPRSGEVLAMANVPTFDPNRIAASKPEARKNRAIADVFEPGSTNKTITAAAALQHGVVTPKTETIVPDNIPLCPEKTFRDSHSHAPELMTFADIVAKSSNVGTIMAARDLGRDRLYKAEVDFGYGRRSGVDLPGESPGIVRPAQSWYCTDLGTNAIGQGVAVTVLQMASVYATVANHGVLRAPTLLRGTVDARGRVAKADRRPGRRVLSTDRRRPVEDPRGRGQGGRHRHPGRHGGVAGGRQDRHRPQARHPAGRLPPGRLCRQLHRLRPGREAGGGGRGGDRRADPRLLRRVGRGPGVPGGHRHRPAPARGGPDPTGQGGALMLGFRGPPPVPGNGGR